MKKNRYIQKLAGFAAILFAMIACMPQMDEKPGIGLPPTAEQLSFTVTPGSDAFHVVITNTSSVKGIASWDFGNGTKGNGESAIVRYPLKGTYSVKMTLVTRGGTGVATKNYTQATTDFSIFTDPVYVNLSGGVGVTGGKTWILDKSTKGHLGVGPSADANSTGLEWWSADPDIKSGTGAYDDELTFKLNEFVVSYDNKGVSYVKAYRKDDATLATTYLNPRLNKDDWDVDYTTPVSGTWTILQKNGGNYVVINSAKPIFPGLDVGAKNNEYKIVQVGENVLELTCFSSYEDWTKWHFLLIPKGYVRPTITYTVNAVEGTDNDVACSVTGYTIPAGQSVTNITWNFGDGSSEVTTATKDDVVHHTFMRKGTYNIVAKVNTSLGIQNNTKSIILANNNSAYVPFLLDMMVVYNDFSEIQSVPVLGQDCSVTIVDNPLKAYPNKSAKVAFYTKTNQQWANANMQLNPGYRFDLRLQHVFKILVYGKAGDIVLLKLENTDKGGNAWQTGTFDVTYTIKKDNTWEVAEYNFSGVGAGFNWTGDIFTTDIVADPNFNNNFYNVVRIMCNPGNGTGTHQFYFDDLSGPHVEGLTK
jgi:hypothetical protein